MTGKKLLFVVALLIVLVGVVGYKLLQTPTGQTVATAPASQSTETDQEEERINAGLKAQVAGLEKENADLRKELRDIAADRAKATSAFVEKAKAAVIAGTKLAAAPCNCGTRVAAASSTSRPHRPPRPAPVDTRPPARKAPPAPAPAAPPAQPPITVVSASLAGPVTASNDLEPQQFYVEVRKGSLAGPLVTEPLYFNVRFLDSRRNIVRKFGLEVLGKSGTVAFHRQPGTAFQVVGPEGIAYVQPGVGSILEGKAAETDPTRVARILFVVR